MKKKKNRWDGQVAHAVAHAFGIDAPTQHAEKSLSPNQIGKIFGVTGEAVKQWIYNHRLPAVKLPNGYWRVKNSDLQNFITERFAGAPTRVLIASAELSSRIQIQEVVLGLKFEPVVALNVADAMLKCQKSLPALIVIDVSGWEDSWRLATKLKNARFSNKIPLLLISSSELTDAQSDQAMELRAVGCIPLEQATLSRELNRLLHSGRCTRT
jgi:hypothetical protein